MAHKLLLVLTLVAAAASGAPQDRLLGGDQVSIQSAPYVVSIKYRYPGPGITIQRCVGSLISSWHVVTSAFCFSGAILSNFRVQAGSTNSLEGGVSHGVTHFLAHPDYQESPRTADVAVLFVDSPFAITDSINVLYLPPSTYNVPVGAELTINGWGFDGPSGTNQVQNLHAIALRTISQEACQATYENRDDYIIDYNTICAAAEGKGLCRGDAGVAATVSNVLVGVGSSEGCGSSPDVFVNAARVSNWILSVAVAQSSEGVPVRMAHV